VVQTWVPKEDKRDSTEANDELKEAKYAAATKKAQ